MAFTDSDKERTSKLEVKKNNLIVPGVGKALFKGQIIDRSSDTAIFDAIFKSGATVAAKGNHTDEDFVVDTVQDRPGDFEVWVSPNGDDTGAGDRSDPLATLGKAKKVASQHAAGREKTIRIMPGDYAENLTISEDNIELIGAGPDDSIMDDLTVDSGVDLTVKNLEAANVTVNDADTTVWFENLEVGTDLTIADLSGVSVRGDSLVVNGTVTDAGANLSRFDG